MELAAGPPSRWRVTLTTGAVVDVWADSVTGLASADDNRDYEFGCLMDIEPDVQHRFEISARTPARPSRVEVVVARFPRECVADISN